MFGPLSLPVPTLALSVTIPSGGDDDWSRRSSTGTPVTPRSDHEYATSFNNASQHDSPRSNDREKDLQRSCLLFSLAMQATGHDE